MFFNAGNKERRECGGHLQVLPGVVLNNMDLGEGGILAEGISNLIQITKSNFNPSRLMICGDKTLMQTSNSELVQKVPSSEFALRKKTWRANTAEVGCWQGGLGGGRRGWGEMAPLSNLFKVKLKNWGDQCVVAAILNPVLDKGAFALFCAADVFVK